MRVRTAALAVLLTAVCGSNAAAQSWKYFDNFCSPGPIRTCGSVHVWTKWDPVAKVTKVELWLQNLQGGVWWDNTGGGSITKFGLSAPKIQGAANLTVRTEGNTGIYGAPDGYWSITNAQVEGPVEFSTTTKNAEGGVSGCALYPTVVNYYQTCKEGWVVFSFTTTNQWDADNAQVAWVVVKSQNGTYELGCRTNDPARPTEACNPIDPTASPEPITLSLVGTGLAGLAAVRRRKKKNLEE